MALNPADEGPKGATAEIGRRDPPGDEAHATVPRYRRIREQLLKRILFGKFQRGDRFDSEVQIAAQFGVSLGTVRKAVDELVAQNVLVRHQGRGTFIAGRDSIAASRLLSNVVGENDRRELPAFERLLDIRTRPATATATKLLQLAVGEKICEVERTKAWSDGSRLYERILLPSTLFPDLGKRLVTIRPDMLYEFYEQTFGVSIMTFDERLRAVKATRKDAELIGCKSGAALLEIERIAFGYDGKPFELRTTRCETSCRYYLCRGQSSRP